MTNLRLKQIVTEVLEAEPAPAGEDVIENVFVAIEANPMLRKAYDSVAYALGKGSAAAWTGFWVSHLTQRVGDQRETATRTTLIESYTRLVSPAAQRGKKLKEPDAVKAMHEHFQANREALPASIRDHRDLIVTLIMEGIAPEAAFTKAIEKPMFAWR